MAAVREQIKFYSVHGNPDKGTYALRSAPLEDYVFILVKRCGKPDESFTYMCHKLEDKTLTQRVCEPAEITAAKAKISEYTAATLTQGSENSWCCQFDSWGSWHVTHLGQDNERFWESYYGSPVDGAFSMLGGCRLEKKERDLDSEKTLKFKAMLGVENFEADYLAQYLKSPLVKAAGKGH